MVMIVQKTNFPFSIFGAGGQCQSPRVCPDFVPGPEFVHNMSSLCLDYVLFQRMTSICLQKQAFVLSKSNFCPSNPIFVLNLSSVVTKINGKYTGQNLVKLWTW